MRNTGGDLIFPLQFLDFTILKMVNIYPSSVTTLCSSEMYPYSEVSSVKFSNESLGYPRLALVSRLIGNQGVLRRYARITIVEDKSMTLVVLNRFEVMITTEWSGAGADLSI